MTPTPLVFMPILVVAQSTAYVGEHSLVGITGLSCECRVLSGRGPCDGLITCPEESYRVCVCVFVSLSVISWNFNLYT
jgi:hypothetical protein